MRLIDADLLKRTLCKTKCGSDEKKCVGWPDSCFQSYRMDMLTLTLDEAPTIDAVPVVRCKDCDNRVYIDMGAAIGVIGGCGIYKAALPEDFYCAYGKRGD